MGSTVIDGRGPASRAARRAATAAGVTAALVASMFVGAGGASAAVPVFPDNLLVFPNRDFISIQGYAEHKGETATIELTRPGVGVVGSAQGVVSGGDVAFEVNHPGGVCWGAGTNLKITPDILPGDVASISFGGTKAGDTTVQDAFVTTDSVLTGATLTVTGHIGAGVITDNTEQRIVEPGLVDTPIGRRDIRAIPGPLTPAPRGGYSSGLAFSGTTFTATYVFDDPAVAQIAADAALGERLLSWEQVDLAGNRQGVTIAEFGEPGGPGFGGCPNGPLQSGPPGPTNVRAVNVAGGVKLTWTPAVAVPGSQPITGYHVTAVGDTVTSGEQSGLQKRTADPAATGTTITGLTSGETYTVEVEAVSSVGMTFPPVIAIPQTDTTPPTVTAAPAGGTFATAQTVTLKANEAGSDIYYTTDGTDPVVSDVLAAAAIHYTSPIQISTDTTLKFAGFDPTGNVSLIGEQTYTITNKPVPSTPAFTTTSTGPGSVTLNWQLGAPTDTYAVQVYDAAGNPVGATRSPSPATATTLTVTGLTGDTPYFFTLTASNGNGTSPESAKLGPLTPQGAVVANAGPDQTIARKTTPTTVTLTGAGSTTAGATYQWTQLTTGTTNPIAGTDPDKVTLSGDTTLSPSFSLPLYQYPMTNKPLTFRLTVTTPAGGKTDDVLVTPQPDQVAIGTAKWKLGDFRVTGTGTIVGGTITVHKGSLAGPILATAALTAAAPPATGAVFDARVKLTTGNFATNPGTVWIESSIGGTAGPFTVS